MAVCAPHQGDPAMGWRGVWQCSVPHQGDSVTQQRGVWQSVLHIKVLEQLGSELLLKSGLWWQRSEQTGTALLSGRMQEAHVISGSLAATRKQ